MFRCNKGLLKEGWLCADENVEWREIVVRDDRCGITEREILRQ